MFLPDLPAVHRPAVAGTEGDEFPVGCCVMDAAPLDTFQVIIVPVHEVHGTDEEGVPVKFAESLEILPDQGLADNPPPGSLPGQGDTVRVTFDSQTPSGTFGNNPHSSRTKKYCTT